MFNYRAGDRVHLTEERLNCTVFLKVSHSFTVEGIDEILGTETDAAR